MTVARAHRNRGIAKTLIESFEKRAAELDYHTVHLTTGRIMETAWRMYEKRGFTRVEAFGFDLSSLLPNLHATIIITYKITNKTLNDIM